MIRKGIRWDLTWAFLTLMGLLAAVAGMVLIPTFRTWRPIVAFLVLSTVTALFSVVTDAALLRRARQLSSTGMQWNMRLKRPIWVGLGEYAPVLSLGAALGSFASLLGWPGVGAGMFVACAIFFAITFGADSVFAVNDLVFESGGLRVYIGNGTVLVPWGAMDRVETMGPQLYQMVVIHIVDRASVIQSTQPANASMRTRVASLIPGGDRQGRLLLSPWIAGIDGVTLERALHLGISQARPLVG